MKPFFFCLAFSAILSTLLLIRVPVRGQDLKSAIKLTESEQFDLAQSQFKSLLSKYPGNGSIYFFLGENFLKSYLADSGNVTFREIADSASRLYQAGIREDPRNPLNYIGLGKIDLLRKNPVLAKSNFDQAMALMPGKNNKTSTMPAAEQADVLMRIADAYIHSKANDTNITLPMLEKARKLNPKNPEINLVTGDAYLSVNDGINANIFYNKAQALDPKSPSAKMRIGYMWVRAKAYNDAVSYYKEATRIDSTFAPAYRELGELYALARQYDNAVKNYKKFLDLSRNNISAKIGYAGALINAKEYREAVSTLNEIIREDSSRNDLNRALAYSYYETSQYDKGLFYIEKFFKRAKPEKIMTSDWIYYGRLLAKNKMDSIAAEKLLVAYNLDTTNTDLLNEIGGCYARLKKYDLAAATYEKIILKKTPTYLDYYNLGKTYFNLKQLEKADTAFSRVNELQPTFVAGFFWRASTNANLDPDTKEGRAKPFYETLIEKAKADTVKYARELVASYEYLAYYYLLARDFTQSKAYYEKVLAIDPKNEKATNAIETLRKYK